jgi:tetratricopeptide (TPR) repeat protein
MNLKSVVLSALILSLSSLFHPAKAQTAKAQTENSNSAVAAQQQLPELDSATEESMIAYTRGMAAMQTGQVEKAIEHFKNAIRYHPRQAQYRYMLASAYEKSEKWINRWFQLRQAVLLRPGFPEASHELLQMWQVALNKGILNVATPSDQVKAALGPPDRERIDGEQMNWQYGFLAIQFEQGKIVSVADLRALENFTPAAEIIEFGFDQRSWRLQQNRIELGRSILQYVPEEQADNKEIFTVERLFELKQTMDLQALANSMRDNLQEKFPQAEWSVIEADEQSVLFEWRLESNGEPAQHEIVRLLAGQSDIHRLAYTARSIEQRETWLNILQQSRLTTE